MSFGFSKLGNAGMVSDIFHGHFGWFWL